MTISTRFLAQASNYSSARRHATTISGSEYLKDPSTVTGTSKRHPPFPFPRHPRPTPQEIFHLPTTGTSSTDIKSRYYDLVRYHHPDSPHARLHTPCPSERNTRFKAILSAYDILQHNPSSSQSFDPYMAEIHRRRRTSQHAEHLKQQKRSWDENKRRREHDEWQKSEGGLKEGIMVTLGIVAILGGLYPSFFLYPSRMEKTHQEAVANLTKARNDAQVVGHLRREEVRKRVKDIQDS